MKIILGAIAVILALSIGSLLFPAIIGIIIGMVCIDNGNIAGGLTAIVIGLAINAFMFGYVSIGGGYSADDEECPYCGSGAIDGNHCDDCGEDF